MPDEGEYARLLKAADSTSKREGIILRLFMLTGLRTNELLQRRWKDIDFRQRTLFIPGDEEISGSTKNGRDHIVPLGDRAIQLLRDWLGDPKVVPIPDLPIFPDDRENADPMRPLDGRDAWKRPWNQIRQEANLRDWGPPDAGFMLRDLRSSVSTWLIQWRGHTDTEVGYLLNHTIKSESVTEAHYNTEIRRQLEIKKSLVTNLEEIMEICERGEEKEEFSTDGFAPALLAENGG
jgi:integrase